MTTDDNSHQPTHANPIHYNTSIIFVIVNSILKAKREVNSGEQTEWVSAACLFICITTTHKQFIIINSNSPPFGFTVIALPFCLLSLIHKYVERGNKRKIQKLPYSMATFESRIVWYIMIDWNEQVKRKFSKVSYR